MGTYKKINGQAIPVTTEGHPQYYFQTKAHAEAALPSLEVGADVFVEEGGNEDVLPRVQELEEDVSEINSNLSAKDFGSTVTLANDTDYTTTSDGYFRINTNNTLNATITGRVNGTVMLYLLNNVAIYGSASLFVRKGSILKITGVTDGSGYFIPLV